MKKENRMPQRENFEFLAHFDGACEPLNPYGNMGIGSIIYSCTGSQKVAIHEYSHYIAASQENSNNVAEYLGLINILEFFKANNHCSKSILIRGDSKLVIMQMSGKWKVKEGLYVPYAKQALRLRMHFQNIKFEWVPRDYNDKADELSKASMIKAGIEFKIQPNQ